MELPKLNDKPKYSVTVPSTGQKVRFRPYLVREEKVLLLAMESQDPKQVLRAVGDTVLACIEDEVKAPTLTTFDLEYLFLIIRSKSVGERAPLLFKCPDCEHQNEVVLNVDEIVMSVPKKKSERVQLTDDVWLKMKWPSYYEMIQGDTQTEDVSVAFDMVAKCIDLIQKEDESWKASEIDDTTMRDFLDSMTAAQYKKITEYVESIPQLKHTVKYDCESCGAHHEVELRGINDFF